MWTDGLRISGLVSYLHTQTSTHHPSHHVMAFCGLMLGNLLSWVVRYPQRRNRSSLKRISVRSISSSCTTCGYHLHKIHSSLRSVPSSSWTTLVLCGCICYNLFAARAGWRRHAHLLCKSVRIFNGRCLQSSTNFVYHVSSPYPLPVCKRTCCAKTICTYVISCVSRIGCDKEANKKWPTISAR